MNDGHLPPARSGPNRRRFLAGAGATLALGAAGTRRASAATPAAATVVTPDPPADGIARGQVFDNQIPDRTVYAGLVFFVWGASTLDQPAGAVPSGYLPAFRDFDRTHDLAWYQANHPDWVVYQADRQTPAYEFGNTVYVPIDFTNPQVRQYYVDSLVMPLVGQGYPIIGFDNVGTFNGFGSCGHYDGNGQWVQQYSGDRVDTAWSTAVLDWLGYLAGELHANDVGVAANITWNASVQLDDIRQAVNLVDVYVDEQGFTVHRDENYNDQAWLDKFDFAREIAPGKAYFAINQTTTDDLADASQQQVDWAIANYLLYREQESMMTLCGKSQYHVFLDRPELHVNIGRPATTPVLDSTGAWKRGYERGRVLVNPSSTIAANVTLPAGTWTDMHGQTFSGKILLAPNSGTVLSIT